jgi:Domain of unknown function (DUF4143)
VFPQGLRKSLPAGPAPISLLFLATATQVIGTIPACAIRWTATSCTSLFHVPEASITAYTSLMTAQSAMSLSEVRRDPEFWVRLVESAVGAHVANAEAAGDCQVFYWRDRNHDVDFVLRAGKIITAIEVKSGRARDAFPRLSAFAAAVPKVRKLLVGSDGVTVQEFLRRQARYWTTGFSAALIEGIVYGVPLA